MVERGAALCGHHSTFGGRGEQERPPLDAVGIEHRWRSRRKGRTGTASWSWIDGLILFVDETCIAWQRTLVYFAHGAIQKLFAV